jgi:hypothetical protein
MTYPAERFASTALAYTTRPAWWCAHSANKLIKGLRESPFTDGELSKSTNGRASSDQCFGPIRYREPEKGNLRRLGAMTLALAARAKNINGAAETHPNDSGSAHGDASASRELGQPESRGVRANGPLHVSRSSPFQRTKPRH